MKVNLTKKHLTDLEKAVKIVKDSVKGKKGQIRQEIVDVYLTLNDIITRHENRVEKDY